MALRRGELEARAEIFAIDASYVLTHVRGTETGVRDFNRLIEPGFWIEAAESQAIDWDASAAVRVRTERVEGGSATYRETATGIYLQASAIAELLGARPGQAAGGRTKPHLERFGRARGAAVECFQALYPTGAPPDLTDDALHAALLGEGKRRSLAPWSVDTSRRAANRRR